MSSDTIRLIAEFFAACVGTIAFALLFQVPRNTICTAALRAPAAGSATN